MNPTPKKNNLLSKKRKKKLITLSTSPIIESQTIGNKHQPRKKNEQKSSNHWYTNLNPYGIQTNSTFIKDHSKKIVAYRGFCLPRIFTTELGSFGFCEDRSQTTQTESLKRKEKNIHPRVPMQLIGSLEWPQSTKFKLSSFPPFSFPPFFFSTTKQKNKKTEHNPDARTKIPEENQPRVWKLTSLR